MDCVKEANKNARPVRSRLGFTVAFGRPWVTLSLMAANIAVFVLGSVLLGSDWNFKLALWPGAAELQSQGFDLGGVAGGEWWRWITSGFVHFGFLHLALNMWVLWQFGSQLEPIMGRVRFGLLYLAGILGSSLAVSLLGEFPSAHGGASGAIFALIAAYVVVLRTLKLDWHQTAMFAGLWLAAGFFVGGISWEGHLGGAIAGAAVMALMLRSVERRNKR